MGDAFRKVQAGQRLEISAEAYNAFIDAALDFRRRQSEAGAEVGGEVRQSGVIKVRNRSGSERDRFDVLGIDGPIIRPEDNLDEFKNQVALDGVTPWDAHRGKFVVLLEPLKADAIGRAVVSGVTVGRVDVTEETQQHCCADVLEGDPAQLRLVEGGAAQVLWREEGLGQKWAVLRLGQACPCEASSSGSSSGESSSSDSGSSSASASDGSSSGPDSSGDSSGSTSADESSGSDLSGSDPSGSDPSGSDPSGSDDSGSDPSGSDASGSDPSSSDPSGSLYDESSSSGSSDDSYGSSSDDSAGSGSSSGPADVVIQETDVRCEGGKLNVYKRAVTLQIVDGVLTSSVGEWQLDHQAGCCCCEGCADNSSAPSVEVCSVVIDSSDVSDSSGPSASEVSTSLELLSEEIIS